MTVIAAQPGYYAVAERDGSTVIYPIIAWSLGGQVRYPGDGFADVLDGGYVLEPETNELRPAQHIDGFVTIIEPVVGELRRIDAALKAFRGETAPEPTTRAARR